MWNLNYVASLLLFIHNEITRKRDCNMKATWIDFYDLTSTVSLPYSFTDLFSTCSPFSSSAVTYAATYCKQHRHCLK